MHNLRFFIAEHLIMFIVHYIMPKSRWETEVWTRHALEATLEILQRSPAGTEALKGKTQ